MPSIDRPLSGDAMLFRLAQAGRAELIDEELLADRKRTARTLVKEGPLRVTLVGLAAEGTMAEHRAEGPITVYVLAGRIRFRTEADEWILVEGDLLSLPAGVAHSVDSDQGGEFLLTVALSH